MHELSIAQSICEIAAESLAKHRGHSVTEIGLRIGTMSDVVPDALEFGFEIIRQEYGLSGCSLAIEKVSARGGCRVCNAEFAVEDFIFICPECESMKVDLLTGQELEISRLVMNTFDQESEPERVTNATG